MFQIFFEPFFWTFFIVIFIFIVVSAILSFAKIVKPARQEQASSEIQPTVKEREIIREIIKIRCPYCGNLYEEKEDKCPYCGGRKP